MFEKFEKKASFNVVGVLYRGKNENQEIAKMWNDQFFEDIKKVKNVVDPDIFYGVCDKFDCETKEFDYVAGIGASCLCGVPAGMVGKVIPDQEYAVFKTKLCDIMETYNYIYNTWFQQEGCKILPGPSFEYYDKDFCKEEILRIYIPIESKPGE